MIRLDFTLDNIPYIEEGIALTLGYFDGLHIGHLSLINEAKNSRRKSALLSFNMDGITLKRNTLLTTLNDREDILEKLGVDYFLVLNFSKEVMQLSPQEFVEKILRKLNVKEVIIGHDYTFGYKKSGNKDYLIYYNHRFFDVCLVPDIIRNGKKISTTYLLEELSNGNISLVNEFLTRNYKVKGRVVKGLNNGKTISYPTANIELSDPYALPKKGVYFTYTIVDGIRYKSMTNIGNHPTISPLSENIIETHIFDFSEDIYDKEIEIEFVEFLREEKKFSSLEELKEQLKKDESYIRTSKI